MGTGRCFESGHAGDTLRLCPNKRKFGVRQDGGPRPPGMAGTQEPPVQSAGEWQHMVDY
jgi:hypothetical protein